MVVDLACVPHNVAIVVSVILVGAGCGTGIGLGWKPPKGFELYRHLVAHAVAGRYSVQPGGGVGRQIDVAQALFPDALRSDGRGGRIFGHAGLRANG